MDVFLRLNIKNQTICTKNEGIKHASYDRVLQKKKRKVYLRQVLKKNECLCKTKSSKPLLL